VTDDADWADETVGLRGDVELAEEGAAVRPRGSRAGIGLDAAHRRHVDDDPAIRAAETGRTVATGLDRDHEVVITCEADGRGDPGGGRRSNDDRRPSIVDRVPEAASIVVRRVVGGDHLAGAAELVEVAWRELISGGRVSSHVLFLTVSCGSCA
jgi:hypothetical protein